MRDNLDRYSPRHHPKRLLAAAGVIIVVGLPTAIAVGQQDNTVDGQQDEIVRVDVSNPRVIGEGEKVTVGFLDRNDDVITCPDGQPLTQSYVGGQGASPLACPDGSTPAVLEAEQAQFQAAQEAAPEKSPDELSIDREIGIYIVSDSDER